MIQSIQTEAGDGFIPGVSRQGERFMRIVALCMAMLLFSPAGVAAELPNPDAAVALVDRIMAKVAAGDLRGGMEIAKPYTIVPVAEFDAAIGQAEMQTPVFLSRFGKSIGHELIRNDAVGQSLIQIVELQKFQKHAMVWRFIFYRGEGGWVLNSFKYADDISSVL
jgi:hypothetical protein